MKPVSVQDCTSNFVKPRGWDDTRDGPCGSLPVRITRKGRHDYHYSNWKPSAEEVRSLCEGAVVELCCVGIQPPVSVNVVTEYKP